DRRAVDSPLGYLTTLNVRTDRRHDRRALSIEEMHRLLKATQLGHELSGSDHRGETLWAMTGPERAMLYRLADETGLRAGELRSLTPASLALDACPPTVTVEAAYSKRRRTDSQPLRPSMAALMREFIEGKNSRERLFAMPRREALAKVFRRDLETA